jgi:hypothetical protein
MPATACCQPCAASTPARCMMSRSRTVRRRAQSGATNRPQPSSRTTAMRGARALVGNQRMSCGCQLAATASDTVARTESSGCEATSASSSASRVFRPPAGGGVTVSGNHFVAATSDISPAATSSFSSQARYAGWCCACQRPSQGPLARWCRAMSEPSVSASGEIAKRQRDRAAGLSLRRVMVAPFGARIGPDQSPRQTAVVIVSQKGFVRA